MNGDERGLQRMKENKKEEQKAGIGWTQITESTEGTKSTEGV